jgi:hypothetical protein|tara:strand:+ start:1976 stop:2338 length:363 start_codon:yes stop_codon:yes gene_type:complete
MTKTFIKIGALSVDAADYETPIERTFREAWTFGGNPEDGVVSVDMDKAKDIWRDKIRQARVGLFESLDAEFMQAMETGADTSDIVAQKNALRDAPADPAIDSATTPEELKLVQPAGLTVR